MKVYKFGKHLLRRMKYILSEAQFWKILIDLRRRRRRNNAFLYLKHALVFEYSTIYRPIWIKPRTQGFWNENVLNYWTNEDWVQNLRMDKETFTYICEEIREFVEKPNTNFKKALTVEMRVAIALYFFLFHAITGQLVIYSRLADRQVAVL